MQEYAISLHSGRMHACSPRRINIHSYRLEAAVL
jgi:hypothetical protein